VNDFETQVGLVSALAEPARRALYFYVAAQPGLVSRDEAAAGAGVPRHTAKFHLDKLVDEGLLETEFRRLSGRGGPGAGRPSKLYRRSARQVTLSLPQRHYELAAQILARAVVDAARDGEPVLDAVRRVADDAGRRLAAARPRGSEAHAAALAEVASLLAAHGYEPRVHDDVIVLVNCPFYALAAEHTALVCDMNLHLITTLIDELGHRDLRAELDPAPGRCCVKLRNQPEGRPLRCEENA
jgi:predicted ArsR family transcriptional regulator